MPSTPVGFPLLGETASVRGVWLGEAIWVTHSGGAGRALAELMTHGDASVDLHEADPERYDNHGLSRPYARARGAQGYREVYDIIHPRQQSEQARGLRVWRRRKKAHDRLRTLLVESGIDPADYAPLASQAV